MYWTRAVDGYGGGNRKAGELAEYELRHNELKTYVDKGYPNRHCRWREVEPGLYQVELWLENNVKSRGVLGKAITKLVARWQMRKVNVRNSEQLMPHGRAECWNWNGTLRSVFEHDSVKMSKDQYGSVRPRKLYHVEYNNEGKLIKFFDARLNFNRPREAEFSWTGDTRKVTKWRGKFHSKETDYNGEMTVTRNTNGKPLDDKGDYRIQVYTPAGWLRSEENHVAGVKHGFVRIFNKGGRVISEEYWVRGTAVPEWIYLDAKSVTPEEIQAEDDEKLREIMLELQGTELYQIRSMARGMRAVARCRLAAEDAELSSELLSVRRPTLVEAKK